MTRLLITDMDGTLVDSMQFLRELAVALIVADGGSERNARHLYNTTFGRPISEQFQAWNERFAGFSARDLHVPVEKFTQLYEAVHALAACNFPTTDFCRALATFRHDLHPEWKFALVTSTHKRIVQTMPQVRHVHWDFVGGYEGPGTEKGAQILRAVHHAKCEISHAVYVGDAPSDKDLASQLCMPYYFPTGTLVQEMLGEKVFTGTIFDNSPV